MMTEPLRPDLEMIAALVPSGARVLDVGCGDGALLDYLVRTKGVDGQGIELSVKGVDACVAKGLPVIQGDADSELTHFPDDLADVTVLSQTLQAVPRPKAVFQHLLRIAPRAIVSIPNFGYWRLRLDLLRRGRMPSNAGLPYDWHDTPNIHLCTIHDMASLGEELGARLESFVAIDASGRQRRWPLRRANWSAAVGLFLFAR